MALLASSFKSCPLGDATGPSSPRARLKSALEIDSVHFNDLSREDGRLERQVRARYVKVAPQNILLED